VVEDDSRVGTVYFIMSEDNLKREVGLPWMSFGSDEASPAPEGVFLKSQSHPRAYGNVARLLGHYVRDEHATTLQDAVRRLTSLPATNLSITSHTQPPVASATRQVRASSGVQATRQKVGGDGGVLLLADQRALQSAEAARHAVGP
jgi:hypothetical protein